MRNNINDKKNIIIVCGIISYLIIFNIYKSIDFFYKSDFNTDPIQQYYEFEKESKVTLFSSAFHFFFPDPNITFIKPIIQPTNGKPFGPNNPNVVIRRYGLYYLNIYLYPKKVRRMKYNFELTKSEFENLKLLSTKYPGTIHTNIYAIKPEYYVKQPDEIGFFCYKDNFIFADIKLNIEQSSF